MWDFPRYASKKWAFSLLRGTSATMEAGAGAGAGVGIGARARMEVGAGTQAPKTVLRIRCKSSLEYLGILVAIAGALTTGGLSLSVQRASRTTCHLTREVERSQGKRRRERRKNVCGGDVCGLGLRSSCSWFLLKHSSKRVG